MSAWGGLGEFIHHMQIKQSRNLISFYIFIDEENEGSDMDLDEFLCADANTDEDEYEDVEDDVDSDFGYGGRSEGMYD